MASAFAPETARSFTVPFTASSPMEPPGKAQRLDYKTVGGDGDARAVKIDMRGVAQRFREVEPKRRGANRPSTSLRLALPPAPWAISICGSRKRTLGEHCAGSRRADI